MSSKLYQLLSGLPSGFLSELLSGRPSEFLSRLLSELPLKYVIQFTYIMADVIGPIPGLRQYSELTFQLTDKMNTDANAGFALHALHPDIEGVRDAAVRAALENMPKSRELGYVVALAYAAAAEAIREYILLAFNKGERTLHAVSMYIAAYEAACKYIRNCLKNTIGFLVKSDSCACLSLKERTPEQTKEAQQIATEACDRAFKLHPLDSLPTTCLSIVKAHVLEVTLHQVYADTHVESLYTASDDMHEGAHYTASDDVYVKAFDTASHEIEKITESLEKNHFCVSTA